MLKDVLKNLREESGLTQERVAELLAISRSTYAYYETGKTKPSIETLKRLARIYRTTLDRILEYDSDAENTENTVPAVAQSGFNYRRSVDAFNLPELTSNEQRLVLIYRLLSNRERKEMLDAFDKKREEHLQNAKK